MNRELFAKGLGVAVESAYRMSFDEAFRGIGASELFSGDVKSSTSAEVVHWSYAPLQSIEDYEGGRVVEVIVEVTDGYAIERVTVFIRERPLEMQWGLDPGGSS